MILRMPEYCRKFRCIAGKCSDSCCIGWEIDIDSQTADFYEKVGGEFGKRLMSCITKKTPKSFVLGENERCPFLNERNLCDIIINLGEEHLCQICGEHPRYYEWFSGVKEGGIGLCCEEAARIILSQTGAFSFWDRVIPDEVPDEYDEELFDCLFAAREKIISHLENGSVAFGQRICDVLYYAEKLQDAVDNDDYSVPNVVKAGITDTGDLKSVLEFFLALEPIDDKWMPYLQSCIGKLDALRDVWEDFGRDNPQITQYLQNVAVYLVWRYFLKGVFDGEFLSRIKIMAVSVAVIGYLLACEWSENGALNLNSCAEIAKNYSKEVEYCEENLEKLADASYEKACLSVKSISGLFCKFHKF